MDKTEQHKKAMLDALEKSLGVVTSACKSVDVSHGKRTTYGCKRTKNTKQQSKNYQT
jgi:hypothetical protein